MDLKEDGNLEERSLLSRIEGYRGSTCHYDIDNTFSHQTAPDENSSIPLWF
jgi:hypothetical protein